MSWNESETYRVPMVQVCIFSGTWFTYHQLGSGEPSAGVFFFVSYYSMLVVSERRASVCLIMLSAKQGGSHWCHFNAFGIARPGIEPTTSRSRSGRSTT